VTKKKEAEKTDVQQAEEKLADVVAAAEEVETAKAEQQAVDAAEQRDSIHFAGPVLRDGESRLGLIVAYENVPNSDGTIDPFNEAAAAQAFVLLPPQFDREQAEEALYALEDGDVDEQIHDIYIVRYSLA
jgi:hypothetical protein